MPCVVIFLLVIDTIMGILDRMSESKNLFVFTMESRHYAINLELVERVIHAVEVTPLPVVTGNVRGVINHHGTMVPVVDTRRMMGAPERSIEPDDVFVIVRNGRRVLALIADSVEHVVSIPDDRITPIENIASNQYLLTGITHLGSDLIMIHDLERCITSSEFMDVERALSEGS